MESNELIEKMMDWEECELNAEETLKLFSYLVSSGKIKDLQGSYGRHAQRLMVNGKMDSVGNLRNPNED